MPHPSPADLKKLARDTRGAYGLDSPHVLQRDFQRIFKQLGIKLDRWPHFKGLNGAYFNDALGPTIVFKGTLPPGPRLFTLAHELKHHLVDRDSKLSACTARMGTTEIERGAETFAAEFLFPEDLLRTLLLTHGVTPHSLSAADVIRFKKQTRATMSYAALLIQLERIGWVEAATFKGTPWLKLERSLLVRGRNTR